MAENTPGTAQAAKEKLVVMPSPHVRDTITTQKIMATVALALVPSVIAAVYYFGIRAFWLTLVCVFSCMLFELLFSMITKRESTIQDCSAIVTGMILACNLPSTFPAWMAIVGSFFAIIVVKCLFGGIGCNFANPAATARVFLLVSFASHMTSWAAPRGVDAMATATPLRLMSEGNWEAMPSITQMFLGQRGGSMGETCALAILAGGLFLLWKGIIRWEIPVSVLASVFVFALLFGQNAIYSVLSGGVMIAAFFMATDYSTSPVTNSGKLVYGVGIGFFTMLIRVFCNYPEGMSFAIVLMNVITPHIDRLMMTKPFGAVFEQAKKS
ncbi:MAG: RnfABCDGE type electron transport complex subunit D [Oscillospiraceae bacterium]|nr:RnfABCDGE type electron transport complex subunit D [Oscillospiraceae bacterium]